MNVSVTKFRKIVWNYYRKHKRDFPWRRTRDPYRIFVSEIMLQQTQTSRVEGKYAEFLKRFPDFRSLAKAPVRDVLRAWSGLGYNRRALNLKKAAEFVVREYRGKLPSGVEELDALPGVGPGTAGAIRAFAFNLPTVFIETNIRRVFLCCFFSNRRNVRDEEIFPLIEKTLDKANPREWYWALMDYGSTLRRAQGKMLPNPNLRSAHYKKQSKFKGSNRELRGKLMRLSFANRTFSARVAARKLGETVGRTARIFRILRKEKLL